MTTATCDCCTACCRCVVVSFPAVPCGPPPVSLGGYYICQPSVTASSHSYQIVADGQTVSSFLSDDIIWLTGECQMSDMHCSLAHRQLDTYRRIISYRTSHLVADGSRVPELKLTSSQFTQNAPNFALLAQKSFALMVILGHLVHSEWLQSVPGFNCVLLANKSVMACVHF